jgi:hypothetical protein
VFGALGPGGSLSPLLSGLEEAKEAKDGGATEGVDGRARATSGATIS